MKIGSEILQTTYCLSTVSIFPAGSEASKTLENILFDKRVIADVRQLSPTYQTSTLEAKHSLDVRFAPKKTII